MTREEIQKILTEEVLFGGEAAKKLKISPQAFNNLVYRKSINPIRVGPGANLFLREDVESYLSRKKRSILGRRLRRAVFSEAIGSVEDLNALSQAQIDQIIEIAFYGFAFDAATNDCVAPQRDCYLDEDVLVPAVTPHCVIKFATEAGQTQLWINGLNIGYQGEGAKRAFHILSEKLNVPSELAKLVFSTSLLKLTRQDLSEWILAASSIIDRDIRVRPRFRYYYHQGMLVATIVLEEHSWEIDILEYLPMIADLLKNPSHIEVCDKNKAVATGRVKRNSTEEEVFQFLIYGQSETQVWINLRVPDTMELPEQSNLLDLLCRLGMPMVEEVPVHVKRFLCTNLIIRKNRSEDK